jgi:YggT family protein
MGALVDIADLLLQTIFTFFLMAVLLRLLLQLARADFYNPISQFLVKFTNPALRPLRRLIPGVAGIDVASIVLILTGQILATILLALLHGFSVPNILNLLIWSAIGTLGLVINVYFVAILVSIVLSWVAPGNYNPVVLLLHQLTEPVMKPFRKIIPPIGGLDLSPIFVFLAINILQVILGHMAQSAGLPSHYVIGV